MRRDAEPPCGLPLLELGTAGEVCGSASIGLFLLGLGTLPLGIFALGLALLLPVCIGLPCGILPLVIARSDLAGMSAGLIDPWDYYSTEVAMTRARVGVILNGVGLLLVGGCLFILFN
jgi:hypothetical protein